MRFQDHPYNMYCECNYCDLRGTLKSILENVKEYVDDEARKTTYDMMWKHYKVKLNNGYKPPENIPHYFITLSLPPDQPVVEEELITRLSQIKYLADAEGIFEYHGEQLQFHPHIHLLVKMKMMNKTNLVKSFSNKLQIPANFVDVRYATNPDVYKTRSDYINGIKTDKKSDVIERDKLYREKHNLSHSFTIKNKNITIL